jgi:PAS domain S-box-containing protein
VLSFELAALSFREPERNRYAYRLEGFDPAWTEADSGRRRITYTNLPPGDYTLRFKGSNNDGVWNEKGGALRLAVNPFWWQTSWFRAGGIAAAVLAFFAAHRVRVGALRRREVRIRSVLESLKSRIALLDRDGRITAANERWFEVAGRGVDYLSSLHGAAAEGDKSAEEALAGIESVLEGGREHFDLEYSRAEPSGIEWHSMTVVPFLGERGGVVVSYTDITDRKRAEEEAQKRREELAHVARVATMGELTASIAHEVNQPLASIVTYANAGRRFLESESSDEVRGVLRSIAEQGKRAGNIIRQLRELMTKGRVESEPLDTNDLVSSVLTLIRSDALARGITIRRSFAPGLPPIRGGRVELSQVILNLVMNAFEAMGSGEPRQLTVRTWIDDARSVEVAVSDTGPPVPEETFQKMFQRFYTSKPSGLGMGLAISQSLVEAHGGRLWAERNPERGLTLRLSLRTSPPD